ncbi:MAG: tRNA 2-selenouridine(34) synthase MnmH [Flavihumibacter sp.]
MAVVALDMEGFLERRLNVPVLDVRSPGEYDHAHIPGAYPLPLFSNEERKTVGTAYKQESREKAIRIGLDFFGPKMRPMVEEAEALGKKEVLVHCWRGGMRSGGVAWLLDLYGFKVYTLKGGYKAFRQWVLTQLSATYSMNVLGGYTGSGKTDLLHRLQRLGEAVIDLEALAHHRGSAFGHLGQAAQPGQEQFENELALQLYALQGKPFWVEDESMRIGNILLPQKFEQQLRRSTCYFLDIPFEKRLDYLLPAYGGFDKEKLIMAVLRIQKRLGGLETKQAVNGILENDIQRVCHIVEILRQMVCEKHEKPRRGGGNNSA